ncbi:proline racemase family protein [Clostridium manihotivorum]|uniref:Proline racemase n=1 Tax=Clostridium manihotivorum TaxID=2320868 RepID=A0A3R5QXD7_9CLOT|nr:proline racemase family protein [Clostridium manihotivorum]QAA34528.1 proline racemase [Clostridium manihotivorum]
MESLPKLPKAQKTFFAVDSHTMGEPTRIILHGFPELEGKAIMEKKKFLESNYDNYRKALMLEPRGHKDMFGAIVIEPTCEEADLGVIFMDSGGYLNMCGHGSIGTATVAVETGLVKVKEPYTEVVLDTPAGIIKTNVRVEKGRAVEVSILNVPAFLYKKDLRVEIKGYGIVTVDISFGGSFFALVDSEKLGISIEQRNLSVLTDLGMKLIRKINESVQITHPYLDITKVDLVEFYGKPDNPKADLKNVVIFGEAQVDRSPCGTGTSAKLAYLYETGKIALGEEFVYESITGSMFSGRVTKEINLDGRIAIIPEITGSAYITGINQLILNDYDPHQYGFLIGGTVGTELMSQSDCSAIMKVV